MAHSSKSASVPASTALAEIELEVRQGGGKPTIHDVPEAGFLIGTVPGCDLRLPGSNLPPVICMIVRQETGAELRRLAPMFPVLINGEASGVTALQNADRVGLGNVEIHVTIQQPRRVAVAVPARVDSPPPRMEPVPSSMPIPATQPVRDREQEENLARRIQTLADNEAQLNTYAEELAREKQDAEQARRALQEKEQELNAQHQSLRSQAEHVQQQKQELTVLGQQLADVRAQLHGRYKAERDRLAKLQAAIKAGAAKLQARQTALVARESQPTLQPAGLETARQEIQAFRREQEELFRNKRDRLAWLQQKVRRTARKVREERAQLDDNRRQVQGALESCKDYRTEVEAAAVDLRRQQEALAQREQAFDQRQRTLQADVAARLAACEQREKHAAHESATTAHTAQQLQDDMVRYHRQLAALNEKERLLEERSSALDQRGLGLHNDSRELEQQARQLEEWHQSLRSEAEQITQQKVAQEALAADLKQRTAVLDDQQVQLAALRTRLERSREIQRADEQQFTEIRDRQYAVTEELQNRTAEIEQQRSDLEAARQALDEQRQQIEEHVQGFESRDAQLKELRETLELKEASLNRQSAQQRATTAGQDEKRAELSRRAEALEELQKRLDAERQALRQREALVAQSEQALKSQEAQLRRQAEDLARREKDHSQEAARLAETTSGFIDQHRRLEQQTRDQGRVVAERAEQLSRLHGELQEREARWQKNAERLKEAGRVVSAARKLQAEEKRQLEARRDECALEHERLVGEQEALRLRFGEIVRRIPELEQRAQVATERFNETRQRLGEHLGEVHTYARRARGDLDSLREQVHGEIEQLRQQVTALSRARDEHNLAVAQFRQAMIDQPAVLATVVEEEDHEPAPPLPVTAAETSSTLDEMRNWYRTKLRTLTEDDDDHPRAAAQGSSRPDILSIMGDVHPADRKLGDLLLDLGLVEKETLDALLIEAHKQRRPLRQALLSGGCLTLYQLALIEAGNLDALVLGPVHPIDRLRSNPQETVYRVYDPPRQGETVLRHLSEAQMQQPGRREEFRESFARAVHIRHPHIASTWEVLEIHGRPAVLQEALTGLSATDWPDLVNVPGVWYRLVCQAALGLRTAHEAGLLHGNLHAGQVILTRDGTLKLCGFGEPAWLAGDAAIPVEQSPADDLKALGELAAQWAGPMGQRKGSKSRSAPAIREIVQRLQAEDPEVRFKSATELLDELEQIGEKVPANAAAWDRLVQHVRDHAIEASGLRQSA